MGKLIDLTGQQFGKLTVISRAENIGKKAAWLCRCDCGKHKTVTGSNLKQGNVQSCGCMWKDVVPQNNKELNTRHGESHSKLHKAWCNMRYRCYNPSCDCYADYGGRGITVCDEWGSYEAFRDWSLANGFAENLSIDRIDNDKGYSPDNCRWVPMKTQANNKRKSNCLTMNGETKTIAEWSEVTGIGWTTIKERLKHGWSVERALTEMPTKHGKRRTS